MRYLCYVFVFLYALRSTLYAVAYADVIYSKTSEETLRGLVVEEHRDRIVVSTEQGEQTILRDEVDEIFYDEPERNYLYLGNQALEAGDVGLARGFFQKALQIHPKLEEAADALQRLEDIQGKLSLGWEPQDALSQLKAQWGLTLEKATPLVLVETVKEGSLASRSGIKSEDGLAAYWGASLAYLADKEVAGRLVGPSGSLIKLTIERKVRLTAPSGGTAAAGVSFSMERLGLTISQLKEKSAASKVLMPADRVAAIQGKSTRYLPLPEALRLIKESKEPVSLTIQRDLMVTRE